MTSLKAFYLQKECLYKRKDSSLAMLVNRVMMYLQKNQIKSQVFHLLPFHNHHACFENQYPLYIYDFETYLFFYTGNKKGRKQKIIIKKHKKTHKKVNEKQLQITNKQTKHNKKTQ